MIPTPADDVDLAQLAEEIEAGYRVQLNLDLSLSTMFALVQAAQFFHDAEPSENIFGQFAQDALVKIDFPPQMARILAVRASGQETRQT